MTEPRHACWIAAVLVSVASFGAAEARADIIGWGASCPPGSRAVVGHIGTYCEPAPCTGEGACQVWRAAGECRPVRICMQSYEVFVRTSQLDGNFVSTPIVVATCEPGAGCDGTNDRAPTVGEPTNSDIECRQQRACVLESFPPLTNRAVVPSADPEEEAAAEESEEAPPSETTPEESEAVSAPLPATVSSHGCGCRTAPARSAPLWVVVIGLGLLVRRR